MSKENEKEASIKYKLVTSSENELWPPDAIIEKSLTLERQSTLLRSSYFILAYLILEITKQIGNFTLTTQNNNKYPIPTPLLIVFIESLKLSIILIYLQISRFKYKDEFQGFSVKFLVPATCYFVTNILYLYALTITSPPIWMILIQTRVLYTALMYKIVFSREVTRIQLVGCILVVVSIFLTRLSEIHSGHMTISFSLLAISQLSSVLSSIACLAVEFLLKNDRRSFPEQQFWLYLWGLSLGLLAIFTSPQRGEVGIIQALRETGESRSKLYLLLFSICASALAGLCVPCIVRNLDSIVKDYLTALNNIFLAFLTALIFPTYFHINYIYGISLVLLLLGIMFYERKTLDSLMVFKYFKNLSLSL